jgi:hypothetical protein
MKKSILSVGFALVVLASSAFGAEQKITCRITRKTMDKCCCEAKDGKFYCKLTKKTYDKCCCDMN